MRLALVSTAAVIAAVSGCSHQDPPGELPDGAPPVSATGSSATTPAPPKPGELRLTRGPVTVTTTLAGPEQRPVLEAYATFFGAYADALAAADPASAPLRAATTPAAFADFARTLSANRASGVTVRGPVQLHPRLGRVGAVTAVVADCLDTSAVHTYDRAGKPTGLVPPRAVQVELTRGPRNTFVVSSLGDGPPAACERSGR